MPGLVSTLSSDSLNSEDNVMFFDGGEEIWPDDVEEAFLEAYELYPSTGRTKIKALDGKLYGRNELISKYIHQQTGKLRSRKQVSSHIQVLIKKHNKYASSNERTLKPLSLRNAHTLMKAEARQKMSEYKTTKTEWNLSPSITADNISDFGSPMQVERTKAHSTIQTLQEHLIRKRSFAPLSPPLSTRRASRVNVGESPELSVNNSFMTASPVNSPAIVSRKVIKDPMDMLLSAAIFMKRQLSHEELEAYFNTNLLKMEKLDVEIDPVSLTAKLQCWALSEYSVKVTTQLFVYGEKKKDFTQTRFATARTSNASFKINLNQLDEHLTNTLQFVSGAYDEKTAEYLRSTYLKFIVTRVDNANESEVLIYGIHYRKSESSNIPYLVVNPLNAFDHSQIIAGLHQA